MRVQVLGGILALAAALSACAGGDAADERDSATAVATPATHAPLLAMARVTSGPPPNASSSPTPRYDIVISGVDASRLRIVTRSLPPVSRAVLFGRATWSPDGRKLAFAVEHGRDPASIRNQTDIYVADSDGRSLRRLTNLGDGVEPVWSPDGRTIAFARRTYDRPDGGFTSALWLMDRHGHDQRAVMDDNDGHFDVPGEWSPDGSLLAFSRTRFERGRRTSGPALYVVRADGSGLRKLTDNGDEPTWSPDGRHIAFVTERDRNGELTYGDVLRAANELYVMNADGTDARRLTWTRDLNERSPSWSGDGKRIAFHRGRQFDNAEGTGVLVVNRDGTCLATVALDPALDTWYARPVWRPGSAPGRATCARG